MSKDSFAQFSGSEDYVTSEPLRNAVNVSIALGRPLLIRGEPGTGKTLLAHSIAQGLGKKLITWNIKSTTKAQDGLYVYDTVQRLNDSRFGDKDISDIKQYIKLGKLGQAFTAPEQVVLLIDEVDKADIEFPNDLLNELDEMSFYIPETNETIKRHPPPDNRHHQQRREGAARRLPAALHLPLHRVPHPGADGGNRPGPLPRHQGQPAQRSAEDLLLAAGD